ncbi:helix-turn-helix domain-containing protein [Aureimonas phyllosphaerae]|uniref:Putative transcriptional regulator n=1 Tax=Aureimonas phyllosphaerae TaxID=1166078 RepID=A0A7W6BSG6_9HYPH|nr:putative transcriptional regulator [Aureimonas phyllosphaerae]MBB3961144.1 putative transcriptional regulator [Aureimonas phyllosphaerae]SFF49098.1 hypothetical protein SAMN05216566_11747 [Aureimonas phyllosphaerae]
MSHVDQPELLDGPLCRAARALLGLSQNELCSIAGCGRKLLNDFENGLVHPKRSKIAAIRAALEEGGAVFVRINDTLMVGPAGGSGVARSARARRFAEDRLGEPD